VNFKGCRHRLQRFDIWKFNGHTEWKAYLSFVAKKLVRGWLLLALIILKNSQYYSPKYILKAKIEIQVQCFFLGIYVCMYVCVASSLISLLLELQKNIQMQSALLMNHMSS
jgi:Na+/H+ antiporter NhaD/arsenite permease-like protein